MRTREELAWAAGFFEGEGVISQRQKNGRFVAINNTDMEPLLRFQEAVGVGKLRGPYGPYNNGISRKPYWTWSASNFEHRQAVIAMLWPWLSARRKVQMAECVLIIKL